MHEAMQKAEKIKLLALDVDGVLTNGQLIFTAQGDELKAFNSLDGHGIKMLQKAGIKVAIITGRRSPLVKKRAHDLGIEQLLQGREDKGTGLAEVAKENNLDLSECAYMGDDWPDLPAIISAGLGITVPNGHPELRSHADFCTYTEGGQGAVREICDLILKAQDKYHPLLEDYLTP